MRFVPGGEWRRGDGEGRACRGHHLRAAVRACPRAAQQPASGAASRVERRRWRTTHYDVDGHTKVVVHKVTPAGTHVLDEHVIAEIPVSDPDYDELFMTAMATARQRQAIFESQE